MKRRLGSMFAGILGLDIACEWALECESVWQLDMVNEDIRRRHYPNALQVVGDDAPRIEGNAWPTPIANDANRPGDLVHAVRTWPTATAGDAESSGSRTSGGNSAHSGTSLTDATRPDRAATWATPVARDWRTAGGRDHTKSGACLPDQVTRCRTGRLNPDWVETLMGFPVGWTRPDMGLTLPGFGWAGTADLVPQQYPRWPRGRYPKGWDRNSKWPGFLWEPPRLITGESDERCRRLEALGNAVCPQQGALAIWAALAVTA